MRKVCVVTGSRAEYGILKPVIQKLSQDDKIQLQIVATGSHLSPEFGLTYKEIEADGFSIDEKVEIVLSSDSTIGVCKAMGLGLISFGECLKRLSPELVIILGDRYEMLAVASAAMIIGIPIAHLHGGELTQGAVDDAIRHAITKMSYLHFASTEEYRRRIIQLGEEPSRVFNVGALGVENVKRVELLSQAELEDFVGLNFDEKVALVTFHPTTLEQNSAKQQFENLLKVLEEYKDMKFIFTKANADAEGRVINAMIDEFVAANKEKCRAYVSMGQKRYLSALKYCSVVIGNSSSGIIEAPSFGMPIINIGNRQAGRIQSKAVINCDNSADAIKKAMDKALSKVFIEIASQAKNPYEQENTSEKILSEIKNFLGQEESSRKKVFYDILDR